MSIGPPIPEMQHFSKFDLENPKVKVIAQGHKVGITPYRLICPSFHVDRPCHSWDTAISKFDVENSRSRSWVRSKLKVKTWVQHSVDSHPFHSMSIGHPIPELWLFQNLTLKIEGQGHGWGHSSKSQCGSNIILTNIPLVPCQSALPFLRYSIFKIWPWRSRVKVKRPWYCITTGLDNSIELRMVQIHSAVSKIWVPQNLAKVLPDLTSFGQITMTLHNYRSWQVHETLNGVNPSSGFRGIRSAKSGPNVWQNWKVYGPWASTYGANG